MCDENKKLERRDFIKNGVIGGAGLYIGSGALQYTKAAGFEGQTIISIFLRGGQDALSSVAPKDATLLGKKRPNVKFGMRNVGDSFFGINDQFDSNFMSLFNNKDLAIIHGVGGVNPTTSHFAQMDFIECGDSRSLINTGFLARFSEAKNIQNMFAVENNVPYSLKTSSYVMQVTQKASLAEIGKRDGRDRNGLTRSTFLRDFFRNGSPGVARQIASQHEQRISGVYDSIKSKSLLGSYRNKQLGLVAEMVGSKNRGTYTLSVGGWDDHTDVKNKFAGRINALFSDVKKLVDDLKASGEFGKTTIVIYSEFGRRIGENGAKGSDHGRGGVAYVIGGQVKGGKIYKSEAYVRDTKEKFNTSEANPRFNLLVDHDIRQVFGQIFRKQFKLNDSQIKGIFNNDPAFSMSSRLWFI